MADEPTIALSRHAVRRTAERGASSEEVIQAIVRGDRTAAKFDRARFRLAIPGAGHWAGQDHDGKAIEVFAIEEIPNSWTVVTVIVR